MKRKIKLTSRIFLINKKFKVNQYYHFLKAPDVTILIPEFKEKFIVITQKREPINKITYEFPGGQIDKNESPVKSSAKELLEETGYKSISKPKKLLDFFLEPGRLSNKVHCFYSKNLTKVRKPEKGMKVKLFSKKQIFNLIKLKKFNSSSHISAFLIYLLKIKKLR